MEVGPSAKSSRTMLCEQAKIPFLGALVDCNLHTVHDVWQFHLYAKTLELDLNFGATPMLPWEAVLFGVGGIPDVRKTLEVPSDQLLDCRNGRDAISKVVGTNLVASVAVFKKSLSTHVKNILSLDRFALLQFKYLNDHVLQVGTDKLHAEVLECLPSSTVYPSFCEVLRFASSRNCIFSCSFLHRFGW